MEDLKSNKYYKLCLWGFILATVVYLIYATITMRGMYLDSSFVMVQLLDSFANNKFSIVADPGHPRFLVWILTQVPVNFANFVLCIHNKYALMMIYSFMMLAFPLFLIFLHYKLAIRTKRLDLYFFSLFVYCVFALPFSIFSLVESPCVSTLIFILINYLVADIDYTKTDISLSLLLSVALCVSAEFYIFVGPMIFVVSLYYAKNTKKLSNIGVKLLIGILSFLSTMFMLVYTLLVPGEFAETMRFLHEGYDVISILLFLCSLLSIFALGALLVFSFRKKKMTPLSFGILLGGFLLIFLRLLFTLEVSVNPVLEGHFRVYIFAAVPIIVFAFFLSEVFKFRIDNIRLQNCLCVVLMCGIFQSCWQIVNTYFWDKNISFMKESLAKVDSPLFLAAEHKPISAFFHPQHRRYIWYSVYTPTSILFSPTYVQRPLLVGYDEDPSDGNLTFRDNLCLHPSNKNLISIPIGAFIHIKNRYWDLSEAAATLDEYNKAHNIIPYYEKH